MFRSLSPPKELCNPVFLKFQARQQVEGEKNKKNYVTLQPLTKSSKLSEPSSPLKLLRMLDIPSSQLLVENETKEAKRIYGQPTTR